MFYQRAIYTWVLLKTGILVPQLIIKKDIWVQVSDTDRVGQDSGKGSFKLKTGHRYN